jgi:hypothetical protein
MRSTDRKHFEITFQFQNIKLLKVLCGSNGERFCKVTLVVVTIFISVG